MKVKILYNNRVGQLEDDINKELEILGDNFNVISVNLYVTSINEQSFYCALISYNKKIEIQPLSEAFKEESKPESTPVFSKQKSKGRPKK